MPTYHQARIPTSHTDTYERLLTRYGDDKSATIAAALDALAAVEFPPSVWGFVKIIPGDIDLYRPELGDDPARAAQCPDCEQPFTAGNVFVAIHSDSTLHLVCGSCVADYNS